MRYVDVGRPQASREVDGREVDRGDTEASLFRFLSELAERMRFEPQRGEVAGYIPDLARIDPGKFAISICMASGRRIDLGDCDVPFSIQSISKVFTLAIALGRVGGQLWQRIGREPSSNAFNSIVELELEHGKPRNPFANAGALVTTDILLARHSPKEAIAEVLHFIRAAATDGGVYVNAAVARSESETAHRNRALAHFLTSCGNLNHSCDFVLDTYFHCCAVEMTSRQLADAGRFLAGLHAGCEMIGRAHVQSINALMLLAGHYNGSGEFAHRAGFPAKSGVGGGILAVAPGKASMAVWSPGLNQFGNSLLGTQALEELSRFTGWSLFNAA